MEDALGNGEFKPDIGNETKKARDLERKELT
jgi:hypothetical protein